MALNECIRFRGNELRALWIINNNNYGFSLWSVYGYGSSKLSLLFVFFFVDFGYNNKNGKRFLYDSDAGLLNES